MKKKRTFKTQALAKSRVLASHRLVDDFFAARTCGMMIFTRALFAKTERQRLHTQGLSCSFEIVIGWALFAALLVIRGT